MSEEEKDRYIHYLIDRVNELTLDKCAMELGVEEFQVTFDSVSASLAAVRKEMEEVCRKMDEMSGELGKERSRRKPVPVSSISS